MYKNKCGCKKLQCDCKQIKPKCFKKEKKCKCKCKKSKCCDDIIIIVNSTPVTSTVGVPINTLGTLF